MWDRAPDNESRGPRMSLASIPGTPTDGSASPMDAYLLEVYRQAAEGARPSAGHRFSGIRAFLAFVGLVTAALALVFSASSRARAVPSSRL